MIVTILIIIAFLMLYLLALIIRLLTLVLRDLEGERAVNHAKRVVTLNKEDNEQ